MAEENKNCEVPDLEQRLNSEELEKLVEELFRIWQTEQQQHDSIPLSAHKPCLYTCSVKWEAACLLSDTHLSPGW